MTNENPYKVGDKVEVTSSTAYSQVWDCAGTVCSVFSPLLTAYCVWVKFDDDKAEYEWPFALEEIEKVEEVEPHSPAEGSV